MDTSRRKTLLASLSKFLRFCVAVTCPAILSGEPKDEATDSSDSKQPAPWLDRMHDGFTVGVDGSSRWVDGFFGKRKQYEDAPGAYGRFSTMFIWQEYKGLDVNVRMRAELPLYNLNKRANAIIGRGDAQEIIEDYDEFGSNPFSNIGEDDWIAGLGYNPSWSKSNRVSFSVGAKLDIPLNPYARVSYRFKHDFNDKTQLRTRQTLFWEREEGFGYSTNLDVDRYVGENHLLRWGNWGKINEISEGFIYDSRIYLYNKVNEDQAMLYAIGIKGETDAPAPIREYGAYITYRRRMFREWFFVELTTGISRLKENDWESRETSLLFGVGFEMLFQESRVKRKNKEETTALMQTNGPLWR